MNSGARVGIIGGLFLVTLLLGILSLILGAVPLDLVALAGWKPFDPDFLDRGSQLTILQDIRLPRVLAGLLAGGALALAGALMQGLFQNPLAGPDVLGVTSGASLASVLYIVTGAANAWGLSFAAALGGLASALVIFLLSRTRGGTPLVTVLLIGLAFSGFTGGIISALLLAARPYEVQEFVFWTLGGLEGRSWEQIAGALPLIAGGGVGALFLSRSLDLFALGEEQAFSAGMRVEGVKMAAMVLAALLTAGAVSLAGPVGFVGLLTPHALRTLLGPRHQILLPASFLGGGMVLLAGELVGRVILIPHEIRAGIITALVGSPIFLVLAYRSRQRIGQ